MTFNIEEHSRATLQRIKTDIQAHLDREDEVRDKVIKLQQIVSQYLATAGLYKKEAQTAVNAAIEKHPWLRNGT